MKRFALDQLGWKPFFQQQLNLEEIESVTPARVFGVERSRLELLTPAGETHLPVTLPPG